MWETRDNKLVPTWDIKCIYCDSKMIPWVGKPLVPFAIDRNKPDVKESHAVDVHVRCPTCYFNEVFGVAIEKSCHDRILEENS